MKRLLIGTIFICWSASLLIAQQNATVKGLVTDEAGEALAGTTIMIIGSGRGIMADADGRFALEIPPGKPTSIEFAYIGFRKDTIIITALRGETKTVNITLKTLPENVGEVYVESWYDRAEALRQINIRSADQIPLPSGSVESILTTMGASIRNEMSAQYSVRGGNFDENLIYVNGIEIYRPMLVKAGQQEGLGFVNSTLVSSIQFAAGGFDARYGDKMSSVLDIRYKRPRAFAASASASLLGGSAHLEGSALKGKLTHITGVRYKANRYLLNTLQTDGDYKPRFFDLQTYLTYHVNNRFDISLLGNMARNTYIVIPQTRKTAFGTYQQTFGLTMYYEGQEMDRFTTLLGAISFDYRPSEKLSLRLTGSGFNTAEAVTADILGEYNIDLLDNTPGSETSGDSILNIGAGGNLLHARNYLNANIYNVSHTGTYRFSRNNLSWGLNFQAENFEGTIREWEMIDSAGYTIPYNDYRIEMYHFAYAQNNLQAYRYAGYVQDVSGFTAGSAEILLNLGARFNYLSTNNQFLVSPRFRVLLIPAWKRKVSFHAAVGWYHQPPFYKEMIDPEGRIYRSVKAQQSVHFVTGTTWDFPVWERPFRFTAEAYYKKLDHLIPYVVDDVDIQYLPQYTAKGYAAGIEFKINGEFVKDAESWATLSFLQTREDRSGDAYGSYPRPTDQLVSFGLFFQDYLPSNPSFRVLLNMFYGSRLPYNSTEYDQPLEYYHLKAYRRIDVGLTKSLLTNRHGVKRSAGKILDDISVGAEIFNLFGFNNMASYKWVRTVSNQQGFPNMFAVPNYLTGRLFNIRLTARF